MELVEYSTQVDDQLYVWKRKLLKRGSLANRLTKKGQVKINSLIPEKVHLVISESIKTMVKTTLLGSNITTNRQQAVGINLYERDELLKRKLSTYRKTAVVEGAGTGAGGIFMGMADFPLLLSIKMKFLFEAATIYGFDTNEYEERLFILHVFQLAFSSDAKRKETFRVIEDWEKQKLILKDMDWQVFQQEYRDYIDLVKMFQLIPGFGAVVGAFANYNLLDHLGETAMNCYRLRIVSNGGN